MTTIIERMLVSIFLYLGVIVGALGLVVLILGAIASATLDGDSNRAAE